MGSQFRFLLLYLTEEGPKDKEVAKVCDLTMLVSH